MDFQIFSYRYSPDEDRAIASLLNQCFIEEGYTERANAAELTSPTAFRKRGNILLARSLSETDQVLGMVILAQRTISGRQVAEANEAELQLLAVHPIARRQGLASRLIEACERIALASGHRNGRVESFEHSRRCARIYNSNVVGVCSVWIVSAARPLRTESASKSSMRNSGQQWTD